MVVAVGPTTSLPSTDLLPLQPFDALQEVAYDESQLSVVVAPSLIVPCAAVKVSVGSSGSGATSITFTTTLSVVVPPAPEHSSWYVVVAVGETLCEPSTDFDPDHPLDAVHEVALVESQVSAVDEPVWIVVGLAPKVRAGCAGGGKLHESPSQVPPLSSHTSSAHGRDVCLPGTCGHLSAGGGGGVSFLHGKKTGTESQPVLIVDGQSLPGNLFMLTTGAGTPPFPNGNPAQNALTVSGAKTNNVTPSRKPTVFPERCSRSIRYMRMLFK